MDATKAGFNAPFQLVVSRHQLSPFEACMLPPLSPSFPYYSIPAAESHQIVTQIKLGLIF